MTTNNLIGYDPLAWMDGETLDETPPAPAKKLTKAKTKAKAAPVVDEPEEQVEQVEQETENEVVVVTEEIAIEAENNDAIDDEDSTEEFEIDVIVDEDGDIEIAIEADENVDIDVEISMESSETDDTVINEIVEEISEIAVEETDVLEKEPEEEVPEKEPEEIVEPLIELNAEATIKNIVALYDTIKRALAAHDTIEINASDVTTIDTATLQLLVSLKKYQQQSHKNVDIIYPSTRFIESAKLLNLLDVLEITEV